MAGQEQHTLHGKILPSNKRVLPELLDGFAKHETAKVGDAMGGYGIMNFEIKPLVPAMRFVGTALTVLTKPGDALFVQKAIDLAQPGDAIVIDAGGLKDVSVIGERLAYFYKRKGVVAIVVDGAVRDSQGIIDEGPPVFARASCIKILGSQGPGAINVPIACGGVPVNPGDIVIGDRDGVVVVPHDDGRRVLALADHHLQNELARVKRIEAGESVADVFGLDAKIAPWTPAK